MTKNPIDGFEVAKEDLTYVGRDLQRPECILAEKDGTLWTADARGGVVRISTDGSQEVITQHVSDGFASNEDDTRRFVDGTQPNGLAFDKNGDVLIANFGTDVLERMTRNGETTLMYDTVDGEPIGKVNFVLRDSKDRVWVTISTMMHDWTQAQRPDVADGRILLVDDNGIRIVADNIQLTNEIRLDANEEWMYVVQTCGRNIIRMRVQPDGELTDREIYGPTDTGRFIDGIAFDSFGNLWGTHVMSDQVFAITPDGDHRVILNDTTPEEIARIDQEFQAKTITQEFLATCGGTIARWMASVTFGGPDLRTVYVGSLRGTTLPAFRSPVAGQPMVHWNG
ncbi:MAG: gluconolactonase [Alphaproteobacteria bacterium]|jgi:gluconolactonase